MSFPESLVRGISERVSQFRVRRKATLVDDPDSRFATAYEALGKRMLIRLFTDEKQLTSLGELGSAYTGLQISGENLMRLGAEFGHQSNLVPTLLADAQLGLTQVAMRIATVREAMLAKVAPERRPILEGEALVQAQRILTERLKNQGLNPHYRAGATRMLEEINGHLSRDIAQTGHSQANPI